MALVILQQDPQIPPYSIYLRGTVRCYTTCYKDQTGAGIRGRFSALVSLTRLLLRNLNYVTIMGIYIYILKSMLSPI